MALDELERICHLLHIDPEQTDCPVYQTLDLDGQSIIHVVPGDDSLAYIWVILDTGQIHEAMSQLIALGEEEQASRQLGVFKLVIATRDTSRLEFAARKQFREIEDKKPTTELILSAL
jgi:hypothetical protein